MVSKKTEGDDEEPKFKTSKTAMPPSKHQLRGQVKLRPFGFGALGNQSRVKVDRSKDVVRFHIDLHELLFSSHQIPDEVPKKSNSYFYPIFMGVDPIEDNETEGKNLDTEADERVSHEDYMKVEIFGIDEYLRFPAIEKLETTLASNKDQMLLHLDQMESTLASLASISDPAAFGELQEQEMAEDEKNLSATLAVTMSRIADIEKLNSRIDDLADKIGKPMGLAAAGSS